MKAFGLVTVFRTLPSRIIRLHELANNLWWSWHPEARALYSGLDPDLWEQVKHNPVRLLSELQPEVHAWIRADNLHPEDIRVDVVNFKLANGTDGYSVPQQTLPMAYTKREQDGAYRYDIHFQPTESGTLAYGVRVLPNHADLPNVYDLG